MKTRLLYEFKNKNCRTPHERINLYRHFFAAWNPAVISFFMPSSLSSVDLSFSYIISINSLLEYKDTKTNLAYTINAEKYCETAVAIATPATLK